MIEELRRLQQAGFERISVAAGLDELKTITSELLGKRSEIGAVKSTLGSLEPDQRREVGRTLNEVRVRLESAIETRRGELEAAARRVRLDDERLDLTETRSSRRLGHLHIVTQAMEELEDVFIGMGFTVSEGPEIETDWYNFEALNFPSGHTARDLFDTMYVNWGDAETTLLRTHTSPVQMRAMEAQKPPIYTVAPGRTYRRDTVDATHMPVFHQIEGLVVDRGITMGDLAGTIEEFTLAYFGQGFTSRLRPSFFPFTEPSAEFDIRRPDGSWLELGGCGMVHPNVLRNGGIDPEEFSGFAFGFGIDRMAMSKHKTSDLRDLYSADIRFLTQF